MEKIKNLVKGHKVLSIVIGVVVIALIILAICLSAKPGEVNTENKVELVKPTFMYFVSNSDEKFEEEMKIVEDLKKSYEDKVVFDIRNVDEDPKATEGFAMVEGNTPFIIMLNNRNDLCVFKPGVVDKNELKGYIKEALKN